MLKPKILRQSKGLSFTFVFFFLFSSVMPVCAQGNPLPSSSTISNGPLQLSGSYEPALLQGIIINPENFLDVDFIINSAPAEGGDAAVRKEAELFSRYFLAALTIPGEDLWVNLSPEEKGRIIPETLSLTHLGREMLEQDYILKQLTASLMNPDDKLGRKFWDRTYAEAMKKFGTTNVPINTFNRVWIVPDKAVIYEDSHQAFIAESHLKVLLEEDMVLLQKGINKKKLGLDKIDQDKARDLNELSSQSVRETIIPALEKEVNEGKHFAPLRQIYHAMILASWYKDRLRETVLRESYLDQGKISGIDLKDAKYREKIFREYLVSFQKGIVNLIRKEEDPATHQMIPRKYFSGGIQFYSPRPYNLEAITEKRPLTEGRFARWASRMRTSLRRARIQFSPRRAVREYREFLNTINDLKITSPYQNVVRMTVDESVPSDRHVIYDAARQLKEELKKPTVDDAVVAQNLLILSLPAETLEPFFRDQGLDDESVSQRIDVISRSLRNFESAKRDAWEKEAKSTVDLVTDFFPAYSQEQLEARGVYNPELVRNLKNIFLMVAKKRGIPIIADKESGEEKPQYPIDLLMINSSIAGGVGDIIQALIANAAVLKDYIRIEWLVYNLPEETQTDIIHYQMHGDEKRPYSQAAMNAFLATAETNTAQIVHILENLQREKDFIPTMIMVHDPQPVAFRRILQKEFPETFLQKYGETEFLWFGHIPFKPKTPEHEKTARFLQYFVDDYDGSAFHAHLFEKGEVLHPHHRENGENIKLVRENTNGVDPASFYNRSLRGEVKGRIADMWGLEAQPDDIWYTHNSRVDPLKGKKEALLAYEKMMDDALELLSISGKEKAGDISPEETTFYEERMPLYENFIEYLKKTLENQGLSRPRFILTGPVATDNPGWDGIETLKKEVDRINQKLNESPLLRRADGKTIEYVVLRLLFPTDPEADIAKVEDKEKKEKAREAWNSTRTKLGSPDFKMDPEFMIPKFQADHRERIIEALRNMGVEHAEDLSVYEIHQLILNVMMTLPVVNLANSLEEGFSLAAAAAKLKGSSQERIDGKKVPGPVVIAGDTGGLGRQFRHSETGWLVGINDHSPEKFVTLTDIENRDHQRLAAGMKPEFAVTPAWIKKAVLEAGGAVSYSDFMTLEVQHFMVMSTAQFLQWQSNGWAAGNVSPEEKEFAMQYVRMGMAGFEDAMKKYTTFTQLFQIAGWMSELPNWQETSQWAAKQSLPASSPARVSDDLGGILLDPSQANVERRLLPGAVPGFVPPPLPPEQLKNLKGLVPDVINIVPFSVEELPLIVPAPVGPLSKNVSSKAEESGN